MPSTECARDDARSMSVCYQELHRYKYQVLRPYRHRTRICGFTFESDYLKLDADGTLEVRKTYAWDGPSGPAPDVPCLMRASLVHDALYLLIRERAIPFELRDAADRICKESLGKMAFRSLSPLLCTGLCVCSGSPARDLVPRRRPSSSAFPSPDPVRPDALDRSCQPNHGVLSCMRCILATSDR